MSNQMSYKGFTASMEFDADDKIIVGKVLNITDTIVFHATSIEEFESNLHQSIEDYLQACAQLNQKPDKPASGRLMLRIAPKLHAAAVKSANESGVSMNKWVEGVLGEKLGA